MRSVRKAATLLALVAVGTTALAQGPHHHNAHRGGLFVSPPHLTIGIEFDTLPRPYYVPPPPVIYPVPPGVVFSPYTSIYTPPIVRVYPGIRFEPPAYCQLHQRGIHGECW